MKWRYISYEVGNPDWNMAVDEAILLAHSKDLVPPTIRFYGWNPATLSIGYFQHAKKHIDHETRKEKNLGFVRRLTGGRAVFHDQELTYSVIVSEKYNLVSSSVKGTYRKINQALELGVNHMMLKVDDTNSSIQTNISSAACFDAPGSEEFLIQGRKVIGSAQTRQHGVLLQHGSILIDFHWQDFYDIFSFPSEQSQKSFEENLGTLSQLCGRRVTIGEVIHAMLSGFEKGLAISLEEQKLTPYEWNLAKELAETKYSTSAWNEKR
ncbi:lipoate--protein ligase family protein [Shimazuella kribbensis]|uniref:lipoate--protein ligase family protein n=1 Tax=Shimazuella kribbensis TaxID=139808 RepID=UPI00042711D7|nr:biotin/lipoate A/B protein ligase family protein [Shimazuella kribbensis]